LRSIAAEERRRAVAEAFDVRLFAAFAGRAIAAFSTARAEPTAPTPTAAEAIALAAILTGELAFAASLAGRRAAEAGLGALTIRLTLLVRTILALLPLTFLTLALAAVLTLAIVPTIIAVLTLLTLAIAAPAFLIRPRAALLTGLLAARSDFALVVAVHFGFVAVLALVLLEIVGLVEALLELRRDVLRLHRTQNAEIMLRMLKIVLRHHPVAGRGRVTRELEILFVDVGG